MRIDVAANLFSRLWAALITMLVLPICVGYIGIEAYGIVGFAVTLQGLMVVLDMGLATTLNRELARFSSDKGDPQDARDLVRTLEAMYWLMAVAIGGIVIALSDTIVHTWIRPGELEPNLLRQAMVLIGLSLAFQWPVSLYTGGLLGLHRQVLCAILTTLTSTLRSVGSVLVLLLLDPTVLTYLSWQIVANVLGVAATGLALWLSLPKGNRRARYRLDLLRKVWRFAGGMTLVSLFSTVLGQMDKLLVSRFFPLSVFGYYSLAGSLSTSIYHFITAVYNSTFPRLSRAVAMGNEPELISIYHTAAQVMAVVVLPIVAVFVLFSHQLLTAWTGDINIANETSILLQLLSASTGLHGLLFVPFGLQVAYGWTSLPLYSAIGGVLVLAPLMLVAMPIWGVAGAAATLALVNMGNLLVSVAIMHRRLLVIEWSTWILKDVLVPACAAFSVASACAALLPPGLPRTQLALALLAAYVLTAGVTSLATQTTRAALIDGRNAARQLFLRRT